jgi:predicted protein tyrosine phosphatase
MVLPPIRITSIQAASAILPSSEGANLKHIISIGGPGTEPPTGYHEHPARKLRLVFDDITISILQVYRYDKKQIERHVIVPAPEHVAQALEFCKGIDGPTLIHCAMGVSRSAAITFALVAQKLGPGQEEEAVEALLKIKGSIMPNDLVVQHADAVLGRNGKLIEAFDKYFRAKSPFAGACEKCRFGQRNALGLITCLEHDNDPSWEKYPDIPVYECERQQPKSS